MQTSDKAFIKIHGYLQCEFGRFENFVIQAVCIKISPNMKI
jgi:hypothetical protein